MSDGWKALTWKQKEAIKLALQKDKRMSISFLKGVYSTDDKRRQAIKTMKEMNFIESSRIGNKYDIKEDRIPYDVLEEVGVA